MISACSSNVDFSERMQEMPWPADNTLHLHQLSVISCFVSKAINQTAPYSHASEWNPVNVVLLVNLMFLQMELWVDWQSHLAPNLKVQRCHDQNLSKLMQTNTRHEINRPLLGQFIVFLLHAKKTAKEQHFCESLFPFSWTVFFFSWPDAEGQVKHPFNKLRKKKKKKEQAKKCSPWLFSQENLWVYFCLWGFLSKRRNTDEHFLHKQPQD